MLVRDSNSRISAKEACHHPWFKDVSNNQNSFSTICPKPTENPVKKLYESFIIENIYTRKEIKRLRNEFRQLDINFEGKISLIHDTCNNNNDHACSNDLKFTFSEFLQASIPIDTLYNKENIALFFEEFNFSQDCSSYSEGDLEVFQEFSEFISTHKLQEMNLESFNNLIVKSL